jgi:hypothetical protein
MSLDRSAAKPAPERLTSDPAREVSLFLVEYQVFCQVHRRFSSFGRERSVSSLRTYAPHPTPSASPVRYENRYEAGFLLTIAKRTRTRFGYTLHRIAGRISSG